MLEELLLLLFLVTFSIFIYKLIYRIRLYNKKVKLSGLLIYELKEAARGGVGYMHFSIAGGVVLSLILSITYYLPALQFAFWVVAMPIMGGLIAAAIYRVGVFTRSVTIHKRLGAENYFASESSKMQLVLLFIIILTFLDLALAPFLYWLSEFIGIIRNVLLAVFYVRPAANLIVNYNAELTAFRTPFMLEDVVEGKVKPEEVKFGYVKISDVDKDVLLSCQSCGEIGACDAGCPAVSAGRLLSPRVVVRTVALNSNKPEFELAVKLEEQVWACTTCGYCVYTCPVRVNHLDVIYGVRRALVAQGRLDKKAADLLMSLSQYGNTQMQSNYGRHEWLRELGVKTVAENPNFEYLFWVGCMGSFDNRARQIVKAFVEVLKEAGMLDKIAILGDEETCCGDPARRLGEESRFQEIVLNNKNLFQKYKIKNIITICPHGYNTFKNEYRRFGVELNVYHHSEFLSKLIDEGKIKIKRSNGVLTIHDPCYLARYNKVVAPQRRIAINLGELKEPRLHGERTFCCGAGGANYWYDVKEERRISHIRLDQLLETGASTIVTLCPFCNAMLSDASRNREVKVNIKDLAELVAENLHK